MNPFQKLKESAEQCQNLEIITVDEDGNKRTYTLMLRLIDKIMLVTLYIDVQRLSQGVG